MSHLPTGTVTLLFTDVEGSTGLIRQVGDRYGEILDEHRRLLCGAVARHGGHEVDTSGDRSFVAFGSARDGWRRRSRRSARWPDTAGPATRSCGRGWHFHTGEPRRAEDGYHGLGVHLAARLCQAGAQILMSESTRALVADDLPAGVTVRDLGERALQDCDRPQAVFDAVIADIDPGAGTGATAAVRVVLAEDSVRAGGQPGRPGAPRPGQLQTTTPARPTPNPGRDHQTPPTSAAVTVVSMILFWRWVV